MYIPCVTAPSDEEKVHDDSQKDTLDSHVVSPKVDSEAPYSIQGDNMKLLKQKMNNEEFFQQIQLTLEQTVCPPSQFIIKQGHVHRQTGRRTPDIL